MPQSLKIIDIESCREDLHEKLFCFARSENIWNRFMMGERESKDKSLHTIMMYQKICPKTCEMVDYIRDKIKGKIKEKVRDEKTVSWYVEKFYDECGGSCSQEIKW